MDGKARKSEWPHAWGDVQHERILVSNGKKCGLFQSGPHCAVGFEVK